MCASHTFGYQGFKSFRVQPCSTLKPGETCEGRATKFSQMGSHIITPPLVNRVGRHAFESIASQSAQLVQPEDYKVPTRKGSSPTKGDHKKMITPSTYQHDFPAYDEEKRAFLSVDAERFERAFQAVVSSLEATQDADRSNNQSQSLELRHVSRVVELALRDTVVPNVSVAAIPRIAEQFVSYFDHQPPRSSPFRDNLTWDAFRGALDHISSVMERELGRAPTTRVSSKVPGMAKLDLAKLIPATTPASGHQLDFGMYGDNPRDRPYMRRRGMASTADDLQPGTARDTYHMPGYAGFLPMARHNPDAVAHGEGADLRGRKFEMRLFHSENIPGYAGHKPIDCVNYRGECRAGSDPKTSTGTAFIPHM
ncbi:hypothetical protein Poli38472_010259 [Pythium oligandrum]|uniref:Uncharacterized protein n=1 Tax=Pythium oligandrum TaxID=41045 RepID=A0A8K1C9E0_PYTOL|nr:hypothetical protein Poli38472_010259 [Pythium oligandrum]|eukprot:TMW58700.1 hypothetical protein Poli38472_010259 [Pythium oligandrum]